VEIEFPLQNVVVHSKVKMDISFSLKDICLISASTFIDMTMEQLWNELQHSEEGIQSPPWHKEVLKAREGNEKFVNWNDAKRAIRNSCK
jgi:hypothetical protein